MKVNYLLAALCLTTCVFCSCGGDNPVPTPPTPPTPNPENPTVIQKSLEIITQREKTEETGGFPDYDKWTYVDLETGDTAVRMDVSEKQWRRYSPTGEKKDRNGNYDIIKSEPAGKDNAPAKWHLAFHIYDVKTNGGEAYMSDTTDIETIKSLPENVKWVADTKMTVLYDLSGMMTRPTVIGCMLSDLNMGLYPWMYKTPGTMSDYHLTKSKSNPNETPVFIVKFKDGSYALIKFTALTDSTGKKKTATFTYKLVKNAKK